MRRKGIVWAAAGALVGAAAVAGLGQEEARFQGLVFSHDTLYEFEMPVGVTATGQLLTADRLAEVRTEVAVPSHYGKLAHVTLGAGAAVLWYEAPDGSLRNVVLDDVETRLYRIGSRESTVVKEKLARRY